MCEIENCNLSIYNNSKKCILHSDDRTKDVKLFWEEIRKDSSSDDKMRRLFSRYSTYENIYFPQFEKESGLAESGLKIEKKGLNFLVNNDNNEFDFTLKLRNCTFFEEADFKNVKFKKGIIFENCIFEKGLNLENNIFQENSKIKIKNSTINNANFHNTTFHDLADFNTSTFEGEINFKKTTFKDISVFTEVTFKDNIDFKYTTFTELAQFKETTFEKKLNLEDSIIKNEINFLKIKNKDGNNLKAKNIANRETARIIKNSFEKQNNIIEANKFYALEMGKREEELFCKGPFFELLIFSLHKITSNHSQSWILVLLWISLLSILGIGDNITDSISKFFSHILSFEFKKLLDLSAKSFYSTFNKPIENINFCNTIKNIFMGYLIYQFIISIRQNTRRK